MNWVNQCDDVGGRRRVVSYVVEFGGIVLVPGGLAELASPEEFSNGPRGHLEDVCDCILRRQILKSERFFAGYY